MKIPRLLSFCKSQGAIFLVCFFFGVAHYFRAQSQTLNEPNIINPIPPSPNAAALGSYGALPVSTYTGGATVSVPIFRITQNGFSIPIELNHSGQAVKVEEIASFVGLGWSLNAGGVITRTVFGRDDFDGYGYLNTFYGIPMQLTDPLTQEEAQTLYEFARQNHDSEPDVFHFNFAGRSGKFVLDKNGQPHIIPHQKLKIEGGNLGWTITTEDGVQFKFATTEYQQSRTHIFTTSFHPVRPSGESYNEMQLFNSSWYLDRIIFPNSEGEITFTYQRDNSNLTYWETGNSDSDYYGAGALFWRIRSFNKNWTHTAHISTISFAEGEIEFKLGNMRCDLIGDKVLDEILIRDRGQRIVKRFKFEYTYAGWAGSNPEISDCDDLPPPRTDSDLRLVLKKVTEFDSEGIEKKNPYIFSYYEGELPSRKSLSQDHWGYYNGKDNTTLIPDAVVWPLTFTTNGTDRSASFEHARIGALKSIHYPTGGTTSFEYEPHYLHPSQIENLPDIIVKRTAKLVIDVEIPLATEALSDPFEVNKNSTASLQFAGTVFSQCQGCDYIRWTLLKQQPDGTFANIWTAYNLTLAPGNESILLEESGVYKIKHEILVNRDIFDQVLPYGYSLDIKWNEAKPSILSVAGGIRIAKIIDYDPISNVKNSRSFEYKQAADGEASGFLLTGPKNYIHHTSESHEPTQTVLEYVVLSATHNFPLATTQGSYIGYSEVSEYFGIDDLNQIDHSNGKITYRYYSPQDFSDQKPMRKLGPQEQELSGTEFPYPNIISQDWKRGLLKERVTYSQKNGAFTEVNRLNNFYSFIDKNNPNQNYSTALGFKVGIKHDYVNEEGGRSFLYGLTSFSWGYYSHQSGYHMLDRTVERTYDQNNPSQFVDKITEYDYNLANLQVAREIHDTESDQQVIAYIYPKDYSDAQGFIKELIDANIINVPIERVHYKMDHDGNNIKVLGGEINIYDDEGKGLLEKVLRVETASPIPLNQFKFSNMQNAGNLPAVGSSVDYSADPVYKEKINYSYNAAGKVQGITTNKDHKCIIWGYNYTLPIASIENATYEEVESALGSTTVASLQVLDGQELSDALAPIRINLPNARVTTYTHSPLVGITSITDNNNITSFFEYDKLGRLEVVRDFEQNIVKRYKYHYQNEE